MEALLIDYQNKLIDEYKKVKAHNYTLDFIYPDKSQREKMNIVNRDMSAAEKNKVQKNKTNIENLIMELENGEIFLEDLGEEQIARLEKLLKRGE